MRWACVAGGAVLLATLTQDGAAQRNGIVVFVTAADDLNPIAGAAVRVVRLSWTELTDRLGRARFAMNAGADTLIVSAVGFRPDTVALDASRREARVALARQAVALASLTVTGDAKANIAPSLSGQWLMPSDAIRAVPPAVEPDPLRAMTIVPAVSFSTPLSARPLIRGYDAPESTIRVDGFEVLNPYHVGRIFSSFPADATESVAVSSHPYDVSVGGSLAGAVDITGRTASPRTVVAGGAAASLASVSAWGATNTPAALFVAGRAAFLEPLTDAVGERVPYGFQDVYGHARVSLGTRTTWDATAFASRDHFAERQDGRGMDWSNVLWGNRWRVVDLPRGMLELNTSANRFVLEGLGVEARNSQIDIANRFTRVGSSVLASIAGRFWTARAGLGVGRRGMENTLAVRAGDDFEASASTASFTELEGFGDAELRHGALVLRAGVRVDRSPSAVAWQPRGRLTAQFSERISASVGFARASRLYQLISDPQPEPSITFYDFWLNAGENGVPVPRVDHGDLAVDGRSGRWSLHTSVFASRGRGLAEVRPLWDQRVGRPPFRYGESRTGGLELRVAWQPPIPWWRSAVLTYVASASKRRWDDGSWQPWRLDRRHQLRLQLEAVLLGTWSFHGLGEFLSGQPTTPVAEIVRPTGPTLPGDTVRFGPPRYRYGPEGSGRSAGTLRVDLSAQKRFDGPGASHLLLGVSVLNVGFGPVAPQVPVPPSELREADGTYSREGVTYRRLYALPAVPAIWLRIEW